MTILSVAHPETIASLAFVLAAVACLRWTSVQIRAVWRRHAISKPVLAEITLEALVLLTPFVIHIALAVPGFTLLHIVEGPELPMASFLFGGIAVLRLVRQRDQHANERAREFGALCAGFGLGFATISIIALSYEVLVPQGSTIARSLFNLGLVLFGLQYFFAVLTIFGITCRMPVAAHDALGGVDHG